MKLHSHEEMLDTVIGKKGTAARNDFEARLKAEIDAYQIGEAIKQTRQQQNLTQKQLGERMGVQEAQISKIESGKSITYATIVRAFKALGATFAVNTIFLPIVRKSAINCINSSIVARLPANAHTSSKINVSQLRQ